MALTYEEKFGILSIEVYHNASIFESFRRDSPLQGAGSKNKGKRSREGICMYIKQATVNNQVGLHARPATFFIQKANEFKSTIWVEKDEQRVNAKSLLGVLSLGIIKGSTIDLIADGTDEKDAVDALVELISSDFAD
jgi:phosphocarrier protein